VLSAVFIPCAFISGITGQFFRQFALTIAVSTLISTFNSLTLSPALTALLLRPRRQGGVSAAAGFGLWAAGAWLGWEFLTPWLARGMEQLPQGGRDILQGAPSWTVQAIAAVVGERSAGYWAGR